MRKRFEGKVALVTGGGSGMGEATSIRLAEEGAAVSIVDIDAAGGERVAAAIRASGGAASFTKANIATSEGAQLGVASTLGQHGRLDVLVANAGVSSPQRDDSWDVDEAEWDRVINVNLRGPYLCAKYAIPELRKRSGGAIVINASIASQVVCAAAPYMAAKGGVALLAKTLAVELAREGIRVNAVGPGYMLTPMATGEREGLSEVEQKERIERMAAGVPAGRMGEPVEVANAIVFLASDEASYITGQLLCVDGGVTAV